MREIKFRAWDNILNEYFAWEDSVKFNNYHDLIEDNYDRAVFLEQYTGLKDKNGVEIYEGDIVRCSSGCPHKVFWEEEIGGMFGGGMPGWYLSGLDDGYAWTNSEEVIGNIH